MQYYANLNMGFEHIFRDHGTNAHTDTEGPLVLCSSLFTMLIVYHVSLTKCKLQNSRDHCLFYYSWMKSSVQHIVGAQ